MIELEVIKLIIILLLISTIIVSTICLLFFVKKWQNLAKSSKKTSRSGKNFSKPKDSAIASLERKLISMVGGQIDSAQRLVDNIQDKNPSRDYQWCLEKAIFDLERDRL